MVTASLTNSTLVVSQQQYLAPAACDLSCTELGRASGGFVRELQYAL